MRDTGMGIAREALSRCVSCPVPVCVCVCARCRPVPLRCLLAVRSVCSFSARSLLVPRLLTSLRLLGSLFSPYQQAGLSTTRKYVSSCPPALTQ